MRQYLDLLRHVIANGRAREDRTGVGTISAFGAQVRYDLREGFPLVTTKRVNFASVVRELLWFLSGSTNINEGLTQYTPIWNDWADKNGNLGPIYGHQWRSWGLRHDLDYDAVHRGEDQIKNALDLIKRDPTSRRIIVSAWNATDLPRMALPPCHVLFQFYVDGQHLDCQLYQRSADLALGVPYNIASYALLTEMVAMECQLAARHFIHTLGDVHIYTNHFDGVVEQLEREPRPLPRLRLANRPVLEQRFEDISLEGYDPHPFIHFPVAV